MPSVVRNVRRALAQPLRIGMIPNAKPLLSTNKRGAAARGAIETTANRTVIPRPRATELTGSLSVALRADYTFFAGASTVTNDKTVATTLLSFLLTPDVVAVFKWRGVEPMP